MRIKIAARQSDLARLQAQTVGRALLRLNGVVGRVTGDVGPSLEVEYQFRASLGDLNLRDPLWKMPEKGVFTEDFLEDLIDGKCDLVVHSWKDLPTEAREKTQIVATLPRADARDLLLVRRDRLEEIRASKTLRVLTSSPRRAYNLEKFFKDYLPLGLTKVVFQNVRGNIPTRLRKLFELTQNDGEPGRESGRVTQAKNLETADALILAKAALDRLLETGGQQAGNEAGCDAGDHARYQAGYDTGDQAGYKKVPKKNQDSGEDHNASDEYAEVRAELQRLLNKCCWSVLPLSANPTAAAQGALAIEIRKDRHDLLELLSQINCEETFTCVEAERRILASYGGGCHQKLGVHVLRRFYGEVTYLRGLTDRGEVLDKVQLQKNKPEPTPAAQQAKLPGREGIWPAEGGPEDWFFVRQQLPREHWGDQLAAARFVWIARESALPSGILPSPDAVVWCAGLKSWKKLAARGVWVHGCAEGLGETESPRIETLCGSADIRWTKLTHDGSEDVAEQHKHKHKHKHKYKHKHKHKQKNATGIGSESAAPKFSLLPTYHLESKADVPDLSGKSHFFWMSGSSFGRALHRYPQIRFAQHACGPGRTYDHLRTILGPEALIDVYLTPEDWRRDLLTGHS